MPQQPPQAEFSRPVRVASLGAGGRRVEIAARPAERARLAARFGLVALDSLEARARLSPGPTPGSVALTASFAADVVQSCVVTLEPVRSRVEDVVELVFAPAQGVCGPREIVVDVAADDPPEPLVGDVIDVGEVVAEHLALALDPYPRAPGASLEAGADAGAGGADESEGPFARLREDEGSG